MEKQINYLSRDFNSIKQELLDISDKYYPEMSETFNDSSVGAWFLDLVSAVGDDLSYSIDRAYQENNINSMTSRSSVLNLARVNGVKVPGPKASMCEIEFSCTLGVNGNQPQWDDAPLIKRDTIVGNGNYSFELSEDVNFAEQFNSEGYSNRRYEPNYTSNGVITSYTVYKTTMAIGGTTRVYKKVITENELESFMEILLPDANIMNVESIIFKATAELNLSPKLYEYYVDAEQFKVKDEYVYTYRYFEVDSLADLYRFGTEIDTDALIDPISGETKVYTDYTESIDSEDADAPTSFRSSRIYKGKWKPLTQKFITEYTDNGYMKIIFGSGSYDAIPSGTTYAEYKMSNMVNNGMLGVLPNAGWTMYVLYRVGGGIETNMAANSITSISFLDMNFPKSTANASLVSNSLKVTNLSTSVAGKDAPTTEEIKYLTKYSIGAQNRCVTVNDYKAKVNMMPPKYGCPFRYNAIEENNKIVLSFLGYSSNGYLDTSLPDLLVENVQEYLTHYKGINDYVEMRSGKVYNIGVEADVFIDKNYTTEYVLKTVIETIKEYFNVNNHQMGDSIFIGDLEKEINKLDGVIALIDFRIYNIYGGVYGSNAQFPKYGVKNTCANQATEIHIEPRTGGVISRVDLDALDAVLENDYDSMFEIKYDSDIQIRCKLK